MMVSPVKLKRHALRAPLAKPKVLNGGPRYGADSPWHGKDFTLPEINKRLMASRVCALWNHFLASFTRLAWLYPTFGSSFCDPSHEYLWRSKPFQLWSCRASAVISITLSCGTGAIRWLQCQSYSSGGKSFWKRRWQEL